ncbi:MAG: membrane protein insertase YidC [Saprospiraceae bacterium]|nr:membrane protein insertase YidC [Saprospiraceae bacterium]
MDRNQIIGIVLIIAVLFVWNQYFFQPELEEQKQRQHVQDSIAQLQNVAPPSEPMKSLDTIQKVQQDSSKPIVIVEEEKSVTLQNQKLSLQFSNKGARITAALIKAQFKSFGIQEGQELLEQVKLLEDSKNVFDYRFNHKGKEYQTQNLYFDVQQPDPLSLVFTAVLDDGVKFIQRYKLVEDDYTIQYSITAEGLDASIPIKLHWENYLDKIEKNWEYERYNSTVYFKEKENDPDYCSCRSDDKIESLEKRVQWISHSHQFYNSTLIANAGFSKATYETILLAETDSDLKKLVTDAEIPGSDVSGKEYAMLWFIGPNEYKKLAVFNQDLQYIIPYGWSIFGTVNRHVIRPMFVFLEDLVGAKGVIILLMTLIVKLLVFPLGYKMLHSQAKMMALKPEIEKVKAKYKDDMQKQQMETMKMYNEFGVNPLGGCFPLLLQMPIWIALYRFFPATIEFRQESFLWAADLTSYDEFLRLPFELPLFGDTMSLFAFLWMVSTLIFSYYSSKSMDFSANPAMKYMQYLMPVIFWFMFNKTAAGLTCYMFFSNILNIFQTLLGKYYLFDQNKIRAELELNKAKPKKTGGFRERLEQMMKEQQKAQQEKAKNLKK